MGKGGYHGGSTVVGRNSGWFTDTGPRPKRKKLTMEELAKKAAKDAKEASKRQAEEDAYFASIQGLPSTITLGAPEGKRRKKRKKAKKAANAKKGNKPKKAKSARQR